MGRRQDPRRRGAAARGRRRTRRGRGERSDPPTDGAIDVTEPPLPDDEPPYPDDEPPYAPPQPSPPRAQSGVPQDPASAAPSRQPVGGGERYGEAVVRQVLGASFVREEPYEPPTRFS
ncbi:hypothetical protein [Microbacterium sp. NIBRBAC000506063]|uniref:hypothetical protein n=1 Tax=Microbacterium sp. NIBRBAC000506063 TaxID=2734618 RepID=UPI001CB709A5|nr:hypothetical protein [Microbacterium sp. NIBRBAC000506063]